MRYRKFGNTELKVSEVGFGTWAIGGPAMAGDIPIGWGNADDATSIEALKKAFTQGVNFYDTADFYGLGHSEKLIGKVFGNRADVIIASKVGHRLSDEKHIYVDYSKPYILQACEDSLQRLNRDAIDYYQLHTAKVADLEKGECIEAMKQLQQEGKIRYWGISLNTFAPKPEADFIFKHKCGHGFQLVFNIINQKAMPIIQKAYEQGLGVIARMPLQFGLLTGKFTPDTRFEKDDHRSFRLTPDILEASLHALEKVWPLGEKYNLSKLALSLSFILSFPEISTVIPGIRTPQQAEENTQNIVILDDKERDLMVELYKTDFRKLVELMHKQG